MMSRRIRHILVAAVLVASAPIAASAAGAPAWPRYGTSDQFQSLRPSTPVASTGFAADHKCAFWHLN